MQSKTWNSMLQAATSEFDLNASNFACSSRSWSVHWNVATRNGSIQTDRQTDHGMRTHRLKHPRHKALPFPCPIGDHKQLKTQQSNARYYGYSAVGLTHAGSTTNSQETLTSIETSPRSQQTAHYDWLCKWLGGISRQWLTLYVTACYLYTTACACTPLPIT